MSNARKTMYQGYEFRSALEARWAAFMNLMKVEWVYEPFELDIESGGGYIPDFVVIYPNSSHILEVKPALTIADALRGAEKLIEADTNLRGVVVGANWNMPHAVMNGARQHGRTCGVVIDAITQHASSCFISYCPKCQEVVFASGEKNDCPNCGMPGLGKHELMGDDWYQKRWAEAHRLTQWQPQ